MTCHPRQETASSLRLSLSSMLLFNLALSHALWLTSFLSSPNCELLICSLLSWSRLVSISHLYLSFNQDNAVCISQFHELNLQSLREGVIINSKGPTKWLDTHETLKKYKMVHTLVDGDCLTITHCLNSNYIKIVKSLATRWGNQAT